MSKTGLSNAIRRHQNQTKPKVMQARNLGGGGCRDCDLLLFKDLKNPSPIRIYATNIPKNQLFDFDAFLFALLTRVKPCPFSHSSHINDPSSFYLKIQFFALGDRINPFHFFTMDLN